MTPAIISRADVRARARAAFEAKAGRESHEMNWHAPALVDWYAEYDRLAVEAGERIWNRAMGREVETI